MVCETAIALISMAPPRVDRAARSVSGRRQNTALGSDGAPVRHRRHRVRIPVSHRTVPCADQIAAVDKFRRLARWSRDQRNVAGGPRRSYNVATRRPAEPGRLVVSTPDSSSAARTIVRSIFSPIDGPLKVDGDALVARAAYADRRRRDPDSGKDTQSEHQIMIAACRSWQYANWMIYVTTMLLSKPRG